MVLTNKSKYNTIEIQSKSKLKPRKKLEIGGGKMGGCKKPDIFPSLICSDLFNLERSVEELEKVGCEMVHVDILDGHFSPSMPLGLDTIAQVRQHSRMKMDVHIMSDINEFFVREMLKIGCERICFHVETTPHIDYLLNMIRGAGVRAGVALKPATPVWMLNEIADSLDFVLLMLINPGYAGNSAEKQVAYALSKVRECRELLDKKNCSIPIEVDGRVTFENIPFLLDAGANQFVGGTGTFFRKGSTLMENYERVVRIFENWGWEKDG